MFQQLYEVIVGTQMEILIFCLAFGVHVLLFGTQRFQKDPKRIRSLAKGQAASEGKARGNQSREAVALVRGIRALLREDCSCGSIAGQIQEKLKHLSGEEAGQALTSCLEAVGRSATPAALLAVREVRSRLDLVSNARLCELLLRGLLTTDAWEAFQELLEDAGKAGISTPGISVMCLRAAIKSSNLEAALCAMKELSGRMKDSPNETASAAPHQFMQQTIQLALTKAKLPLFLDEIASSGLLVPWVVEVLLRECAKTSDVQGLCSVEEVARKQGVELTAAAHATLISQASDSSTVQRLLGEAFAAGCERGVPLAAAADFAAARGDAELAGVVLERFRDSPSPLAASALVRLIAEGVLAEQDPDSALLELYEKHMQGSRVLAEVQSPCVRMLAEASLKRGRLDILRQVLSASTENFRPAALVKSMAEESRLQDAFAVFEACPEKTTILYNSILDACIACQDMQAAEKLMKEAVSGGVADVVTYNVLLKAHAQTGDLRRSRACVRDMRAAGLVPNHVTLNELVVAQLKAHKEGVWTLIEEMKACGLQPNQVTVSILLRSLGPGSKEADIRRTFDIVSSMEDEMDEVMLSSVCESLVRLKRADLLRKHLGHQRMKGNIKAAAAPSCRWTQTIGAYTYGSVIRAYSFLRDLQAIWSTWKEMRSQDVVPTCTTLGCMVEALVTNDGPEAGYDLIHEVLKDEAVRPSVNAIVYCSVLKGFCHLKRFDRAWSVYREMKELKLKFSVVTYNTLIDACARCREVDRIPGLLKEMAKQGIEPNVITYSTIMKGHCVEKRLDKAFELLEKMKSTPGMEPDNFTYNTLLDGCACQGLLDKGIEVLDDMQRRGVPACSFTLSLAAKLASRGGSADAAFQLCEDLARQYNLSWNVHVYNNLLQACTANKDIWRALVVFGQMTAAGVRPDPRTYTLLLRGLIDAGEVEEAVAVVRAAHGLEACSRSVGKLCSNTAALRGGLPEDIMVEVRRGIAGICGDDRMARSLLDLR